jgi:hypothetical protein
MGGAVRVSRPPRVSASLALARYRVSFEAVEPLDLPAYLGSTLRGASGRAFRRLCCLGRDVFGQWTHVGSGTTFGLGGDRIEP